MTAVVIRGDAGNLQLPDESVDLVVTSPPYFGLRSYTDGGQHYAEQVGAEATPAEYLDALMACTAEWMRVLKPSGSIFVNLGDKYSSGTGGGRNAGFNERSGNASGKRNQEKSQIAQRPVAGMPAKSLVGLPWRYAIRCIDELGLILRAEIIWAKPNGLPESVTDRVRRSHEQVFHFTKAQRYYSAVDHIREPLVDQSEHAARRRERGDARLDLVGGGRTSAANPLGKLPGSVWSIATSPLRVPAELEVDHFAAYPPELVRRIVLGWSPREVCTACREGRRPVITKHHKRPAGDWNPDRNVENRPTSNARPSAIVTIGDKPTCSCDSHGYRTAQGLPLPAATPGVVLDPFGGTGTTALVASVHGRLGISNDLSADYCRIARWRTEDPKQRAKAAGVVAKPKKVKPQTEELPDPEHVDGQLELGGAA